MTSIVGVRCRDGVVIGADSAATSGDGNALKTMEILTDKKIEIIDGKIIVAHTGSVGHAQRFTAAVKKSFANSDRSNLSAVENGKLLSVVGINDFLETKLQQFPLTAYVAFPSKGKAELCELAGWSHGFQPELKEDIWFCSAGAGQPITDPFLALLRKVLWADGAPSVGGGIFTVLWALMHVCEINPGGISEPIRIATLTLDGGKPNARILEEAELQEHKNIVMDAMKHMASFKEILEGTKAASDVPMPAEG